jgi:hypothetical protein
MTRTEQSACRAGHAQDRTLPHDRVRETSAEILELEDMAHAFGARIPASIILFPTERRAAHPLARELHPFS